MEIRAGKVIFSSSGGTAEKNSVSCKISLPTAWIKALGFDKDDREAELHFDGHTISICKKQTADSYIALHKQSGHTLKKYSFYDNNELCTVIYADHTDKTVFLIRSLSRCIISRTRLVSATSVSVLLPIKPISMAASTAGESLKSVVRVMALG